MVHYGSKTHDTNVYIISSITEVQLGVGDFELGLPFGTFPTSQASVTTLVIIVLARRIQLLTSGGNIKDLITQKH